MRVVAALAAIAVLLLVGPLAGPALAAPPVRTAADAALRFDVEELGPRVVTADGPSVLSVVGSVTNTGDEPVDRLAVRVQRGEPLSTEGEIRDALRGAVATDAVAGEFVDLPGELAPGATAPVRLAIPLRGGSAAGLALTRAGVYEVLLNVNGVPAGGGRVRLAAVRMLLPVLSLPPADTGAAPATPAPQATPPVPFTLLYPITDAPRRLATVPGEPTLLTDDELAGSFAPGGRLHGVVTALAERAPTGSQVRAATCLAIDADLVATAAAMREGYQVRAPDGTRAPGDGGEIARRWLDLLGTTARDGCVLALPYADADLVALTRGDLVELATGAVTDGRVVLSQILSTPVLAGTTWPVDGVLDERTLARAVAPQGRAVVLSADAVASGSRDRATGVVPVAGGERPQLAVLADPLLARAAAGPEAVAVTPTLLAATTPAGTEIPLATQDTIGALAFRARTITPGPDPLVLAPPHQWGVERTGAGALLTAVDQMMGAGLLVPRPLAQLTDAGIAATGAQRLTYPLRAGAREIPPEVVDAIATTRTSLTDLRSAAVEQGSVGIGVDDVFGPLDQGLVRAASAQWRGRPDTAGRVATTQDGRVQELRASVRVLEPPSPYALGSTGAPLLLTVANGLPISMRVRVELASSGGLAVAPIPEQLVPPQGRRQVQVSAEVTRSGQFTVDAVVRTPDGGQLGPASRLRVRSTAYGTITLWLTGTAGVLLVVLAARRVLRRIRGEADPTRTPTPRPPNEPDPTDRTTRLPTVPPGTTGRLQDPRPPPGDETAPLRKAPAHPAPLPGPLAPSAPPTVDEVRRTPPRDPRPPASPRVPSHRP